MDKAEYTFCITHQTLRPCGGDDYAAGKVTIDIRGWNAADRTPCFRYPHAGFQLEKLTINAWYSEKFPGTYGHEMGVDLGSDLLMLTDIERYSKPLKMLEKRITAIETKFGPAKTIGQSLAYVASALGLQRFARPNTRYASGWQSTTDCQDAIRWCDLPIAIFHEEHAWKTSTA